MLSGIQNRFRGTKTRAADANGRTGRKRALRLLGAAGWTALALFLLSGAWAVREQAALADKVVRLHVLANSDSPADQAVKLAVRDAVAARTAELLTGAATAREAEARLRRNLPALEQLAAETAEQCGGGSVRVELARTAFPTRRYDGFALPAGEYTALRIVVGEGRGRNWWCVVFPPLCTASTEEAPAVAVSGGFTEEEVNLVTEAEGGYVLKFRVVELWGRIRNALSGE